LILGDIVNVVPDGNPQISLRSVLAHLFEAVNTVCHDGIVRGVEMVECG
jgi:hypothetical protein